MFWVASSATADEAHPFPQSPLRNRGQHTHPLIYYLHKAYRRHLETLLMGQNSLPLTLHEAAKGHPVTFL